MTLVNFFDIVDHYNDVLHHVWDLLNHFHRLNMQHFNLMGGATCCINDAN
jgi:hypothetical protein